MEYRSRGHCNFYPWFNRYGAWFRWKRFTQIMCLWEWELASRGEAWSLGEWRQIKEQEERRGLILCVEKDTTVQIR
jgi:hypothetical protein